MCFLMAANIGQNNDKDVLPKQPVATILIGSTPGNLEREEINKDDNDDTESNADRQKNRTRLNKDWRLIADPSLSKSYEDRIYRVEGFIAGLHDIVILQCAENLSIFFAV